MGQIERRELETCATRVSNWSEPHDGAALVIVRCAGSSGIRRTTAEGAHDARSRAVFQRTAKPDALFGRPATVPAAPKLPSARTTKMVTLPSPPFNV